MKIRVNKVFFIFNLIILTLMLAGPILAFCLTDSSNISYLMFIPIGMIVLFFSLNFLIYFLSPFVVNEEGFIKYILGRKKFNIKKDDIIKINVIFADTNQSHVYCIIFYYHKGPNKINKTEFSGNLFNLTNVFIALKKYNFPLEY